MARARQIGLLVVFLAATAMVGIWFARPVGDVHYLGSAATANGRVTATVRLRLEGIAAPDSVTVDVAGQPVTAARLR